MVKNQVPYKSLISNAFFRKHPGKIPLWKDFMKSIPKKFLFNILKNINN
jgi:hypothetical protein